MRRILVLIMLVLGILAVPSSASALPLCEDKTAPEPADTGSSAAEFLFGGPAHIAASSFADANDPTADFSPSNLSTYDEYGTRANFWHVVSDTNCFDENRMSFWDVPYGIAWEAAKYISDHVIMIWLAGTLGGFTELFSGLVSGILTSLRESLWRPFLPVMVILGAVSMAWWGLARKRATMSVEGAIWMVAAVVLGIWMLNAPQTILNIAATPTQWGGYLVQQTVSVGHIEGVSERCPPGVADPTQEGGEPDGHFIARQNAMVLWEGMVCRPWMAGIFGTGPNSEELADEYGMRLIEAQAFSMSESQGEITEDDIDEKKDEFREIGGEIEADYPAEFRMFSGAAGSERLGLSLAALAASVIAGAPIFIASLALIVFQLGFMICALMSPVMLTIGIHPGVGRTMFLRFVEFAASLLIKQIVAMLAVGLLTLIYSAVFSAPIHAGFQLLIFVAFAIAMIVFWRSIWKMFSISVTGQGGADNVQTGGIRSALGKVALAGAVLASGGTAAAGAGAARTAASGATRGGPVRRALARRTTQAGQRVRERVRSAIPDDTPPTTTTPPDTTAPTSDSTPPTTTAGNGDTTPPTTQAPPRGLRRSPYPGGVRRGNRGGSAPPASGDEGGGTPPPSGSTSPPNSAPRPAQPRPTTSASAGTGSPRSGETAPARPEQPSGPSGPTWRGKWDSLGRGQGARLRGRPRSSGPVKPPTSAPPPEPPMTRKGDGTQKK